jgi:tRNA (cmo5U34)-methyltransferase
MMDKKPFDFEAKHGSEHEQLVRAVIPGYEHLFLMAHAFLQARLAANANLLIAGAGGGMELVTFGIPNPGWRMTAVDPSPNMLDVARSKVHQL